MQTLLTILSEDLEITNPEELNKQILFISTKMIETTDIGIDVIMVKETNSKETQEAIEQYLDENDQSKDIIGIILFGLPFDGSIQPYTNSEKGINLNTKLYKGKEIDIFPAYKAIPMRDDIFIIQTFSNILNGERKAKFDIENEKIGLK